MQEGNTINIVPGSSDSQHSKYDKCVTLKLPDEISTLLRSNPQTMSIKDGILHMDTHSFPIITAPETQTVDVALHTGTEEATIVGRVSEKWTIRQELQKEKMQEIRQLNLAAEKERKERKTMTLENVPVVSGAKKRIRTREGSSMPTIPTQPTKPYMDPLDSVLNPQTLRENVLKRMDDSIQSPLARSKQKATFNGNENVPLAMMMPGEKEPDVIGKVSTLLTQHPMTMKELLGKIHRKSSLIESALGQVAVHDPATNTYSLKPNKSHLPDDQRRQKYDKLCMLFKDKYSQYIKIDEGLRRWSSKTRTLINERNYVELAVLDVEEFTKQDMIHARLTRELGVIKANIVQLANPNQTNSPAPRQQVDKPPG